MNVITDKSHAILGPSGWDRWSTCPGSVVLEEGFPNHASAYAAEGTVAHEIASRCLTDNADAEQFVGEVFEVERHVIVVDMEMADAVNTYVYLVKSLIDVEAGDTLLVEQEVPIGHLTGEKDATGTADVVGLRNGGTCLIVIDFKYGKGVPVYASDPPDDLEGGLNGQLGMYALGALEKFAMACEDVIAVELAIIQPRLREEPSLLPLPIQQLRDFGEEVRLAAGRVALAHEPDCRPPTQAEVQYYPGLLEMLNPSEKACKFCRAKSTCPALRAEVSGGMAIVSKADDFADLTLPKQAASIVVDEETPIQNLAEAMRAAPLIEDFIKAVRAEAERRLLAGLPVPGFKLVEGRKGNRQWFDGEVALDPDKPDEKITAEIALKKRLGVKGAFVTKLISVAEAEKQFKAKPRVWAKIVPLITQGRGKPSVAPESDPRPPLALGADPDDFADLSALAAPTKEFFSVDERLTDLTWPPVENQPSAMLD